ncbi:zinc ribbon domain-containing protein [Acinetobacter johnsonii]|uniref:zinc-ribbon domain-containing protein n=1 Tax=Acinetobacter johnsonii TaxID=40214 RepID=UPI00244D1534|nr:zinc-ribbon domain-containing protein [Acinetobacter johnsonii]MDH1534038.1 zinc ribbon domain-containing protein [Acinetobacter johnsonii]
MAIKQCKECGNQVSDKAQSCPSCGAKQSKKMGIFAWIAIIFVGLLVIGAIADGGDGSSVSEPSPKELALQNLGFDFEWGKAGFDSVMEINMTIKNNGTKDVKDLTVECVHSSNSGTVVDRNKREVYEVIKAGETKKINNFNMGFIHSQATSSSCSVVDLVVM